MSENKDEPRIEEERSRGGGTAPPLRATTSRGDASGGARGRDAGSATAEYVIATMAAVGFAGLLRHHEERRGEGVPPRPGPHRPRGADVNGRAEAPPGRRRALAVAGSEAGTATAELAIVLPVLVLVLAVVLGSARVAVDRMVLGAAAVDAVRLAVRGDATGRDGALLAAGPTARVDRFAEAPLEAHSAPPDGQTRTPADAGPTDSRGEGGGTDPVWCLSVSSRSSLIAGITVPVRATACALTETAVSGSVNEAPGRDPSPSAAGDGNP
ncbi:DUF4244 domain-containing protein [Mycetocola reblochoni]